MIGHHKHFLLVGINDIDALVSKEKLLLLPILELKYVFQLAQTWIHIVISFHFMIGHHKHVLLVGINDIDAFGIIRKTSLITFFRIEVHLSIGINIDSHNNLPSFQDWAS